MQDRILFKRLKNTKKSILFLGPRQVGKSTLIRLLGADLFINLANEENFIHYAKDPGRITREVKALKNPKCIIIDEVQRLPSLLNTVQYLIDENPALRFILTGSSARKLKRGAANLLPGRILLEFLDPLSFWEMGDHFDLMRCLRIGSLPGIYLDKESGEDILGAYAKVYLREEVQAEALTKNLGAYARFLDLAAENNGFLINYSKMAADCEIPKETLRRFFSILEDTLLVFRIPPFRPKKSKRRVSQRDKYLFFDLGVRNALLGVHKGSFTQTDLGHLFEQWILLQCQSYSRMFHKEWKFFYYRTDAGAEVDIVIDNGRDLLALEVKYGHHVASKQLRGLRSFESIVDRPIKKYIVFQGENEQKFDDGELVVPYKKFLNEILPRF